MRGQSFTAWLIAILALGLPSIPRAEKTAEPPPAVAAREAPCPSGIPAGTRCLTGRDVRGAWFWIAVPANWNQVLVLHAHGGPELGEPRAERSAQDMQRWAVMVRQGYAWAASTYRQGGVAVRAAAQDTETLRQIFTQVVAHPRVTILHGQSWGASVAARAAEAYPDSYDGVLLSSGVLGGGSRSYDFRLDLRVVYEALCHNHPLPSEPDYPLWQGLPLDSHLTRDELARRVDDCTGVAHPAAERSPAQQARLDTLLKVIRIPERSLIGHLAWATWDFQDIAFTRLDGGDAFGNIGAHYRGSPDDAALNASVARYRADDVAKARFAADTDPTGDIRAPVLTVHAIDDPVAFVELDHSFGDTMARAGQAGHLVQTFTDEHEHSYLSDPEYQVLMQALLKWVASGGRAAAKPTPEGIAQACKALDAPHCHFVPAYRPAPLSTRITPRAG